MFYEKVVEYCEKEGLSLSAFEKKCGIGNGTVARWKDNASKPSLATIEKIAKNTKVPISKWLK